VVDRFRLAGEHRLRSLLGLLAVLVLYFALPIDTDASATRLAGQLVVSALCIALAGRLILREVLRMLGGESLRLTGLQLVVVLEVVMVMFAFTYFSLAIHGHQQMAGIHTRVDALYFSATTMTTVGYGDVHPIGQVARVITTFQLIFDVVFIAAFVRLLTSVARVPSRPADEQRPE
jgi:voltage-gated potassium channel Kch